MSLLNSIYLILMILLFCFDIGIENWVIINCLVLLLRSHNFVDESEMVH